MIRACDECGKDTGSRHYFLCPDCYTRLWCHGVPKVQCKGITKRGERCGIYVRNETGYCPHHEQPIAVDANDWLRALVESET